MLRALGFILVSICVIASFLCATLLIVSFGSFHWTVWKPGGYSIGYWLEGGYIHIRRCGYGPEIDGDFSYHFAFLSLLFSIPAAIWYGLHRKTQRGAAGTLRDFCAACMLIALFLAVICVNPLAIPIAFGVVVVIFGFRSGRRRPTMAQRRASMGLCPNCGYDMRAIPHRCPECGEPTPVPWSAAELPKN